jgi:hypothetical protein
LGDSFLQVFGILAFGLFFDILEVNWWHMFCVLEPW